MKRTILDVQGPTSIYVDIGIKENGDVLISGQDIGEAPLKFFKRDDYEYWYTISSESKDALLLALFEYTFKGDTGFESKLRKLLKDNDIEFEFSSY